MVIIQRSWFFPYVRRQYVSKSGAAKKKNIETRKLKDRGKNEKTVCSRQLENE
jgi:hypothetical protein